VNDKNEINLLKPETFFGRYHISDVAKLLRGGELISPFSVFKVRPNAIPNYSNHGIDRLVETLQP
jgi:hypothetical protein